MVSLSLPRVDALMNASNELALVTDDASLFELQSVSYRRSGELTGLTSDSQRRPLGRLARPLLSRVQGCSEVLLVLDQPDAAPLEKTLPFSRSP